MLKIGLTGLTTKQLDYLGEQTIALSEKNINREIADNILFRQVKTTHEQYRRVVMKQTFSGMGEEVKAADITRDKFYSGLARIISGFSVFDGTAKQDFALFLQKIISDTGSVSGLSYAEESVVLNKLLERLSADEARNAIAALGIAEEVEKLVAIQKNFDMLFTEQLDANSGLRQQPTASGMRKELESVLRNYFALVSAMRGVESWKDIYSDLGELLKKF